MKHVMTGLLALAATAALGAQVAGAASAIDPTVARSADAAAHRDATADKTVWCWWEQGQRFCEVVF